MVLRALEQRNTNAGVPDRIEKLALKIPAANDIWFASIGPAPSFLPVQHLKSATAGLNPKTREFELHIEADSRGAAQSIAETVNGRAEDNRVSFTGPVPKRVLDWILGRRDAR